MMKLASNITLSTGPIHGRKTDPVMTCCRIRFRTANSSDLESINQLIAAAIDTWQVADRVKRISMPLYRYHEDDLQPMQIVVAHCDDEEILGIAALERAHLTDRFDGLSTSLLHGIYVAPNLHRNGLGSRLLEKIESLARSQASDTLLVKASPEAISFFHARGFARLPGRDRRADYPYQFYKIL